jgi:hypothetical protein
MILAKGEGLMVIGHWSVVIGSSSCSEIFGGLATKNPKGFENLSGLQGTTPMTTDQ